MTFNESNTVEAFVRDRLKAIGWEYIDHASLPRQPQEVLVEEHLRDALVRLNPAIAERPERADEVLYRLRAAIMTVRDTGLVKANEEFAAWLLGERSMPFGPNGEHVTIHPIDFEDLKQNRFVVTQQFTFRAGKTEKRADLVLIVNGMPLVVIEAKTPVRSSESWFDAAVQVHDDYERNVPELFVPNVFSVATEGKEYRYGTIAMPVDYWGRGGLRMTTHCRLWSKSRSRSTRCCGRTWCSTCWRASPPTPRTKASVASRSSPATSRSKA